MKIAYFTESLPPLTDGVSHTLSYLRTSLISEGHSFRFFAPFVPEPDAWDGKVSEVISIPFPFYTKYRFSLPQFHDLKSALAKFQPDLVHICSPFLLGMIAYEYAREAGIPAVNSYHTRFVSYLKYYGFEWFEPYGWAYLKWFYNRASKNYVPSRATLNELDQKGFHNLALWQRGLDTSHFSPLYADRMLRERWSPDGAPVALFAGRLVKEKDVEVLIQANKILEDKRIDYKLVFVGDGPMRDELIRLLPKAIFPGFLRGHDLSRAYATADIFVFPSTTESFGNVVLEAAASGLPCVVAAEGGVMDLIHDGETGYLTRPRDARDFAEKMERLLSNGILRDSLSVRAQEFASEKSWDEINRGLFNSYEELIKNGKPLNDHPAYLSSSEYQLDSIKAH
jgi:phosphatidylinositol alpha 1,6-mannosyltransferase